MARRRYVSIKEVAARAGVSFQTASKVLNGGDVRVSAETEERILAAAAELGYRPNTIARSLVQRATATIGLVASDATDVAIAQASVAAEQAARKNGHSVLVGHLAAGGADGADIVRTLIERRVDGIIAAAPEVEEDTEVADLLRRYVPSVSLQAVPGGGVPLVGSEPPGDRAAGRHPPARARAHLPSARSPARSGGGSPAAGCTATRTRCATPAWSRARTWWPRATGRRRAARLATRLLLERSPGLTAIFVHSDVMAIGVLSALWQAGRRVPADVAVVSCDDIPFAEFLTPPLTTVRIPLAETGTAGRRAAAALHRRRAGAGADARCCRSS